jgi:hypothetical protein
MPNADRIQRKIDSGRGKAARALGGPFKVYRITGTAAQNFIDPLNLIKSNYLVYHTQKPAGSFRGSYEGINVGAPLFDIIGDMGPFLVGDVFINTDPPYEPYGGPLTGDIAAEGSDADIPGDIYRSGYGAGATSVAYPTMEIYGFCLGFHGAIKKAIGARLDRLAQVFRLPEAPAAGGYWQADQATSLPIVLTNGTFAPGTVGQTAAFVPVGLAARPRWKSDLIKSIPTSTGELEYYCYVPPLYGFSFQESDRIVLQDGSQYVVQLPWEQEVGFVGSQLAVQRQVLQG